MHVHFIQQRCHPRQPLPTSISHPLQPLTFLSLAAPIPIPPRARRHFQAPNRSHPSHLISPISLLTTQLRTHYESSSFTSPPGTPRKYQRLPPSPAPSTVIPPPPFQNEPVISRRHRLDPRDPRGHSAGGCAVASAEAGMPRPGSQGGARVRRSVAWGFVHGMQGRSARTKLCPWSCDLRRTVLRIAPLEFSEGDYVMAT